MAEEELAPGDGWISDDSSFYGDEDEQERLISLCEGYNPHYQWHSHHNSLNVLLNDVWNPSSSATKPTPTSPASLSKKVDQVATEVEPQRESKTTPTLLGLDRKAMEGGRLKRLANKKHGESAEVVQNAVSKLHNIHEGLPNAWQLGESADDFVRRLPPVSTPCWEYTWIWCANPHYDSTMSSGPSWQDILQTRGSRLLQESAIERQNIQSRNSLNAKGLIQKLLVQEAESLKERLGELAEETNVLTGKWMLFPELEDLTRTWRAVVEGTSSGRLGCDAKVATDNGKSENRLICIYTKDYRDAHDVLRVLQELVSMGLVGSGRGIHYKSDAYTLLNIYGKNAADYGLQASIYSSQKMLASSTGANARATPQKKQSTLDGFHGINKETDFI